MPETTKISDVLKSREKWGFNIVTLALLVGLGCLGFFYWGLVVPFILDVVTNTIKLAVAMAALVGIGFMFFDPRLRTLWIYGYRSVVRWITKQFTEIDPIGIMNTYVSRLKERLEEMGKIIADLQGQRNELANYIDKSEHEREEALQRASVAKKLVDKGGEDAARFRGQLAIQGRQAGRLLSSTTTLKKKLAQMDGLLHDLKKIWDSSNIVEQDIENEVKRRTEDYKMMNKSVGAIRIAGKIMMAGGPEKELYDETLNTLDESYSKAVGEIDWFKERAKSMIDGADLDNMAYEDSATQQLAQWEKDNASIPPPGAQVRIDVAPADDSGFSSLYADDDQKPQQQRKS